MQQDLYLEQQDRERKQAGAGVSQYFRSREGLPPSFGIPERKTISGEVHKVRSEIEALQLKVLAGERIRGINLWGMPILAQDADKLAVITLNIMWNSYSQSLTSVCLEIARAVKQERYMDDLKHTHKEIWSKIQRFKGAVKGSSWYKYRNQIKAVDEKWSYRKRIHVGNALMECVFRASTLFHWELQRRDKRHTQYYLSIDPQTLLEIENSHDILSFLYPKRRPMLVPPMDWEDRWRGGYLSCTDEHTCHTPLIVSNMYISLPHRDREDFGEHLDAINCLQKTAWRINKPVLDIVDYSFKNNLTLGGLLSRDPDPFPEKPHDIKYNQEASNRWKTEARQVRRYNRRMLGARTSLALAIEEAKDDAKRENLYYVWYMDWRGRESPRGSALTPQGADPFKAMLKFSNGHRLGDRGFFWLTVHLANCMGYDKKKFSERIKYVEEMTDEIHRWAQDPLEHKGWASQDDPYMCLAAAYEWSAAVRSKRPHDFVSHLPINMDGTTNGLQHLSALGRDLRGAMATNLCPVDNPNDIYGEVADNVKRIIAEDFDEWVENGGINTQKYFDIALDCNDCTETKKCKRCSKLRRLLGSTYWIDRVDRKTCKRGTMTRGYSVTRQGVRTQLLEDGFLDFAKEDPNVDINIAADYMRDAIWHAQESLVSDALSIMEWLKTVAKIACDEGKSISWRTPAGLLVDQQYLRPLRRTVKTADRWYTVSISEGERKQMVRKQVNAISPNFIHSLDSSHLTKVTLRLYNAGITDTMMIYDSYGVHACFVDTMRDIIREEFVKMHEAEPLLDFKKGVETYIDADLPDLPARGSYNIRDMLTAEYAFG